jgi:DNA-binding protein Fis
MWGGPVVASSVHRFWRVNKRMKRVIVQIFPVVELPADPSLELSDELAPGTVVIPETPAVRSPNGNGENLDAEVRVEAILSAERARTVVDTVLNVNGTEAVDTFDRLIDLLVQREMTSDNSGQLFNRVMSSVEKALVERAFVECDHVQTRTAERLGVNRNTIHKKLLKHELLDPEDETLHESDDELIESHPDHELNDLPV